MTTKIPRHVTALTRDKLSLPIRTALQEAVLRPGMSVFDYGCGKGSDVRLLAEQGYICFSYDPYYQPRLLRVRTDFVNCGFVLNVIENQAERVKVVQAAWQLTKEVFMLSVRARAAELDGKAVRDGQLSQTGSFQKFFSQPELEAFVQEVLGITPLRNGLEGSVYCFRTEESRERYLQSMASKVPRHLTAPARTILSVPLRRAHTDKVLQRGMSIYDYGCGRGDDLKLLTKAGFRCIGYDPHWQPKFTHIQTDLVNLGFVLNVIENPAEREQVLSQAWRLAKQVLVVAVRTKAMTPLAGELKIDGRITEHGTFQKFFTLDELVDLCTRVLGVTPVSTKAVGVVYCFKTEARRLQFLASQDTVLPDVPTSEEDHDDTE